MSIEAGQLRQEAEKIRWFHTMDLGHGVRTNGRYDPSLRLDRIGFPADLSGKTVLDIGAWDGFYSFECERRGAARVVATDSYVWSGGTWAGKDGFNLARKALDSNVEDRLVDVLELSPENPGGTFDVVLFLGVLYHMRYPMLAIDKVASVCHGQLILETHADLAYVKRPAMAIYTGDEQNKDPTNHCGPNAAAVIAMLKKAGFSRVEIVPPASRLYHAPRQAVSRMLKRPGYRMAFHAFR